ncbi:hypothetical protein TNCV_2120621 [Trichonephila clavipes]|nr:hypothetical protein TNCV_2120621 [Trichonephila clavipes]
MKPIEIYRQICEFMDKPLRGFGWDVLVILRTALTLPGDFHLFLHLSLSLPVNTSTMTEELKENVSNWLKTQAATFYEGIKTCATI